MKLLLDQNLSHRLITALTRAYPDSSHVSLLNMGEASDLDIWRYAILEGYGIVTQHADFHEYSLLYEGPPLIIWLKCGNQPRSIILEKLLHNRDLIEQMASDKETRCIEVY